MPPDDVDPWTKEQSTAGVDCGLAVSGPFQMMNFLSDGEYAWMERTYGRSIQGSAIFLKEGRIDGATHGVVSVTRARENSVKGVFCEGHVQKGSAPYFAVGMSSARKKGSE